MSYNDGAFGIPFGKIGSGIKKLWSWGGERNAPQIEQNPYMGDWNSLIGQLQQRAAGNMAGSVSMGAYQQAHNQGLRDQASMAAGGSAGQVRQAGMNVARMNQGLAQGLGQARLQEQLASQQALQAALTNAGQAWFMPQQANLQAQVATPTNGQQLLQFLQQAAMAGAKIAGA